MGELVEASNRQRKSDNELQKIERRRKSASVAPLPIAAPARAARPVTAIVATGRRQTIVESVVEYVSADRSLLPLHATARAWCRLTALPPQR